MRSTERCFLRPRPRRPDPEFALPLPLVEPLTGVDRAPSEVDTAKAGGRTGGDPHLRSATEVAGYTLQATDGTIGRVDEFLFDERSWAVEHLVVDTRAWWPGGEVVLPRTLVTGIDWAVREAKLRVNRQAVKDAPPWNRDLAARDDSVRDVQHHFESSI